MTTTALPQVDVHGHAVATLYESAVAAVKALGDASRQGQVFAIDPDIRAAWPGARLAGSAFTVQGAGGDNLALHHGVYAAPPGSVLVVDVNSAEFGHWGEVLAVAAQARNIIGLVIDGGVRDTREMQDLGFPVFSRNNSVRGTRKLFRGGVGIEIVIGGVPIRTGDTIVGDADGLIVLPAEIAPSIVEHADLRVATERQIIERINAGETTLDLYDLDRD